MVNYAYLDVRRYCGFYSSEVLPPFLVAQVVSLQNSLFRNPKRGGQVILHEESAIFKAFLQDFSSVLPYSYWALIWSWVPHKRWARLSFGPWTWIRQARQASFSCFYPLQLPPSPHLIRRFCARGSIGVTVKTILTVRCSWGDGQKQTQTVTNLSYDDACEY